jgi:hypothetical protein
MSRFVARRFALFHPTAEKGQGCRKSGLPEDLRHWEMAMKAVLLA